jgi:DNA-directed RNA polymerase subunit RPC12/RpoP
LHFAVGAAFFSMLWVSGGLEYLGSLQSQSEWIKGPAAIALLVTLLGTIYLYDRFFLKLVTDKYAHDPHQLHWSERLNRDGKPFCPDCGSIYMYRPDSAREEDYVRCGDCGFAIAPLAEMLPFFEQRAQQLFGNSPN